MPEAPFKVQIPDEELAYVKQRLLAARYPDQLANIAPWEDGTDLSYFKASQRGVQQRWFVHGSCLLGLNVPTACIMSDWRPLSLSPPACACRSLCSTG